MLSPKMWNKTGTPALTPSIQHSTGSSTQHNKEKKENKGHIDQKGKSKAASICSWHDGFHKNPKEFPKNKQIKTPRTK